VVKEVVVSPLAGMPEANLLGSADAGEIKRSRKSSNDDDDFMVMDANLFRGR
jgi:hypothetical protein